MVNKCFLFPSRLVVRLPAFVALCLFFPPSVCRQRRAKDEAARDEEDDGGDAGLTERWLLHGYRLINHV